MAADAGAVLGINSKAGVTTANRRVVHQIA
jgi:hypothetical protein